MKENEKLIDSFHCAFTNKALLLQGILYVTTRCCYFYSPFAQSVFSGVSGTRLVMPFSNIAVVKKSNRLAIFPTQLHFSMKDGNEYLFSSLLSRDSCYILITHQMSYLVLVRRIKTLSVREESSKTVATEQSPATTV